MPVVEVEATAQVDEQARGDSISGTREATEPSAQVERQHDLLLTCGDMDLCGRRDKKHPRLDVQWRDLRPRSDWDPQRLEDLGQRNH